MPKAKWGSGEDALTTDDLEGAEYQQYERYTGEVPPSGVYRVLLRRLRKVEFNSGSQGLKVFLVVDGSWKQEHKRYDGAPIWDQKVFTKPSAPFVRNFADALGVSYKDLLNNMVIDEDGYVVKIGRQAIADQDLILFVDTRREMYEGNPSLKVRGTGYLIGMEDEDGDSGDDDDDDTGDDDAPF